MSNVDVSVCLLGRLVIRRNHYKIHFKALCPHSVFLTLSTQMLHVKAPEFTASAFLPIKKHYVDAHPDRN